MSSKKTKNEVDVAGMQLLINQGILLAQRRLLDRGLHDDLSFVVWREGKVCDVPAQEIETF